MDRIFNIDELAREYLANIDEVLGEVKGMVETAVWCCLVCGSQGRRCCFQDEAPAHTPVTLGMGACVRDSHTMALINWGFADQAVTVLGINFWKGGKLRLEVSFKGRGFDGLSEILYVLTGLAQIAAESRQTLLAMVPRLGFEGGGVD